MSPNMNFSRKDVFIANVDSCKAGTMRCGTCGQKITKGLYAYYEKSKAYDWAYVTHHRECIPAHPCWKIFDDEQARREAFKKEFIAACIAFKKKWDVCELDEYIDDFISEVQS